MICKTCDSAGGFCEPHQVEKTAHLVHLCNTRPEYLRAWNEGRGPRQRKPALKRKHKQQIEPRDPDDVAYILKVLCPECPHYHAEDKTCHGQKKKRGCGRRNGLPVAWLAERGCCPIYRW